MGRPSIVLISKMTAKAIIMRMKMTFYQNSSEMRNQSCFNVVILPLQRHLPLLLFIRDTITCGLPYFWGSVISHESELGPLPVMATWHDVAHKCYHFNYGS